MTIQTVGTVLFRKFVCDFAIVAEILKGELANPKIGPGIKDEVMTLGNQAASELNTLGEKLKELFMNEPSAEDLDAAAVEDQIKEATNSEPDATGDSSD